MIRKIFTAILLTAAFAVNCGEVKARQNSDLVISRDLENTKPIWVSISGISGEALQVLQFDLYVQGYNFTNATAAQFVIAGSNNGNFQATATDNISKKVMVSKSYSGVALRRQVHAFVDDFSKARNVVGIASSRIAFKGETRPNSEIYIADFDGHSPQALTTDKSLVAAPSWAPGNQVIYYTSYRMNHADIWRQETATGARKVFARYGGSNISPAVSPDGSKVAMILSKDGWTDLYVCNSDGTGLTRLTKSPQDESSPCWSPDGRWICFAAKGSERRSLCKISASGGAVQSVTAAGATSPSEPDWSPDGKLIAFTVQHRDAFEICVVDAKGGEAISIAEGEDPSWSANSRTLICSRRHGTGGDYVLALVDVPTKQTKDVSRISGSNSQSQPNWAKSAASR